MKKMQVKLLKAWLNKRRQMNGVVPWTSSSIPRDVPKGHLVVYVGENHRRFVINVKLLKHPLFSALLDQAREEYDFTADSRLYIPCDEDAFLSVLHCAALPQDRRITFCLRI
ncbi:hypothetical protein OSB04_009569 [Centaurea solstitialis]|uniref:Small auxin up regulated protein n=1 Tax=Centaurea solstitialis TaxID=347529 RepID=A0AA38T5V5_9ASTR|nr:hypothetical protein OSB04_009569 [Centaurea solstitialis]